MSDETSVTSSPGGMQTVRGTSVDTPQPGSDEPNLMDSVIISGQSVVTSDHLPPDNCVDKETPASFSELNSHPQADKIGDKWRPNGDKIQSQLIEKIINTPVLSDLEAVEDHLAPTNGGSTKNDGPDTLDISICGQSEKLRNFLSECDQHQEQIKELKALTSISNDKEKIVQDASEILENAMANLAKSKSSTTEMNPQNFTKSESRSQPAPSQTRQQIISQTSFQDIYSEIELIESTDPFHKGYKRDNSADDFYSLFLDTSPESPISPEAKPRLAPPKQVAALPAEVERSTEMQDVAECRLVNTWSEFMTPANIYSLVVSNSHIWFTDKNENIYYSTVGTPKGIQWRKATGRANQISVSPSGQIVWRLHRGTVYAGTKISSRHPEGLKWVEAIRDVLTISVDNDCAW